MKSKTNIVLIIGIIGFLGSIVYMLLPGEVVPVPVTPVAPAFPIANTLQGPGPQKTFDELLPIPPRPVFKSVLDSMHLDVYGVLPCAIKPAERVIMLTAKYSEDKPLNTFESAVNAVTSWEQYIGADLGPLLFPNAKAFVAGTSSSFVKVAIANPAVVSEYEKMATIKVDGAPATLYYAWSLNYVFFATSQQCLEDAMISVYPGD